MKTFAVAIFVSICISASGQSLITTATYEEEERPALSLVLSHKQKTVKGALQGRMNDLGYEPESKGAFFWKSEKIGGYFIYKGVLLPCRNGSKFDLYFKIDSRDEDEKMSTLYMLTSKGYDNFISKTSDPECVNTAKDFLDAFVSVTTEHRMELDIAAKKKMLKDSEEKLSELEEKEENYKDDIDELKDKIDENREAQDKMRNEIKKQESQLSDLNSRLNDLRE